MSGIEPRPQTPGSWCQRARRAARAALAPTALALSALALCPAAQAEYPDKAVRLIVPFAVGGGADVASRLLASELAARWGQGVVVDNQVGANSIIGAQQVARASADGYTLLVPNDTTLAANPALYKKLPYDPIKDFAPIALIGETPFVLVASPKLQVSTVQQLVEAAKARPGDILFSTSGVASAQHLPMEMLMRSAGIDLMHVPYKGASEAATAILGDQAQVMFAGVSAVLPLVRAGRLVPLAVGTSERLAVLPEVPTMAESGFAGFRYGAWLGLVAPASTPPAIIERINADVGQILEQAAVRERLSALGFLPARPQPAASFQRYIASELARYQDFIRAAGIEASN